jgi:myo-inositol 2-dehydrogenase / D-chiro-inositol 1-dehydrogenase
MNTQSPETPSTWSRRQFLGGTLAAAAATSFGVLNARGAETATPAAPVEFKRKIKLGVVGNGGRGGWIAGLFQKHGGYDMHAVADYFPEVADQCGNALGVDKSRRFSTLSGYKRLLESGVEAVTLEVPPYFFPEQARAAVEAGLHVYMAKPVAVDVPGCLQILAASRQAAQKQHCFYVDYQMPTDPINREVRQRIHTQSFARIVHVATAGIGSGFNDPPRTNTIESRLRNLIWVNDVALGGDLITNFDIHAIDTAIWALGKRPVAAAGGSSIGRPDPHGDSRGVCSVVFEYADGLVHNHFGQALKNQAPGELSCRIYSQSGYAIINYWGKSELRSFDDTYSGSVDNLYEAGAMRNIAEFYQRVTEGRFENDTPQRAVDGALTCILGREAAARHTRMNLDELLKENRKLEADLTGLKT